MKKLKLKSIRYKFIFVMVGGFLLFVTFAFGLWYSTLKAEAETTSAKNMKTIINVSNTIFESQVKDICNVMTLTTVSSGNYLSTNIINILSNSDLSGAELVAYRKEASDFLISLCSFKKYLNGMTLSDFHGNNVAYGITTPFNSVEKSVWFQNYKKNKNKSIFIEPHYYNQWNQSKNDLVFSVTRPIYDLSGNMIGFAMADIKCQLLKDTFDANTDNKSALYLIDNQTGKVIFTPQKNLLNVSVTNHLDNVLIKKMYSNSGDFFVDINGKKMLAVYNKSSFTNWTTLSVIPQNDILENFSEAIKNILIITLIVVLSMISIIVVLSSLLTKNIVRLTNSVSRIGDGNLKLDVLVKSNDEVGALYSQFNSMLSRINQLLQKVKSTEGEKRKAELSALQFQMNPHFLYNSLNIIKFLSALQGNKNTEDVAESLSSLMHTNMDGRSFISIEEDIKFLNDYFSIQKYRYINTFHYDISVEKDLEDYYVPKLIVQPLVENALKHGISQKHTGGIILVKYFSENDILHIRVEDNGAGMEENQINKLFVKNENKSGGHIGIYNISERIKLYFDDSFQIDVQSQPGLYTRIEITMPLIKKSEVEHYA